jgi:hypothetical protein
MSCFWLDKINQSGKKNARLSSVSKLVWLLVECGRICKASDRLLQNQVPKEALSD